MSQSPSRLLLNASFVWLGDQAGSTSARAWLVRRTSLPAAVVQMSQLPARLLTNARSGGATPPASKTRPVGSERALAVPAPFVAVTRTRSDEPTSTLVSP
jgi:hypothetical protein